MKEKVIIKVSSRALLEGLQKAHRVVPGKSSLSILAYIHMRVDAERNILTITGGNSETQVEADVELQEASKNTSFCVETVIVDLMKTICDQPLTMEVEKERKDEKSSKIRVHLLHASGVLEIAGMDDELYDFKLRPTEATAFEIGAESLLKGIKATCAFSKKDELRPILNGIYADLPGDGSVVFVATDMGNLSRYVCKSEQADGSEGFLVPNGTAGVLTGVLSKGGDKVSVVVGKKTMLFEQGAMRVTGMRTEGRFPNYKSVFRENSGRLIVDAGVLRTSIERLLRVANGATAAVRMEVNGRANTLRIAAEDVDWKRSGEETLTVDSDYDLSANINGRFVCEMLELIEGEAIIQFTDGAHIIQIEPLGQKDDGHLAMLTMPMY